MNIHVDSFAIEHTESFLVHDTIVTADPFIGSANKFF